MKIKLGLLFAFTAILMTGCATSGNPSAKSNSPTVSGYISTSVVKKF